MATQPRPVATANFQLEVPLDASTVEQFKPEQPVKVLVANAKGPVKSTLVKLDAKGHGSAKFTFSAHPGDVRVILGPQDASDKQLPLLSTIVVDVPAKQWAGKAELKLAPSIISSFYWRWWLTWCRKFVIHGRVVCPDGRPVPGAKVCAYDVDWWWWWLSEDLIGCQTTGADGTFTISFTWCCGWWPWWWWSLRHWRLELPLAERIGAVLSKIPRLPPLPVPGPKPDLSIFDRLIAKPAGPVPPRPETLAAARLAPGPETLAPARFTPGPADPMHLDVLQKSLLPALPPAPELTQLRVWPWVSWTPWWDCTPDIIFRVTQNCAGAEHVIVNETIFNTRFNVPTSLDVTLTANSEACCIHTPPPPPPGNCVLLSSVCNNDDPKFPINSNLLQNIGGNVGAPATPVGYENPGKVAADGDRPYAGTIAIFGQFGAGAAADYYEFEYSDDNGANWHAMPAGTIAAPARYYYGPPLFGEPLFPPSRATPPTTVTIGTRTLIETHTHFEAAHGAGTWGTTHFWVSDWMQMASWITSATTFNDGTYRLRVRNWTAAEVAAGADITTNTPLDLCDADKFSPADRQNHLYLTIDNRLDPDPSHPTGDHACGPGTVHICTREPDTHFTSVRLVNPANPLDFIPLVACTNITMRPTDNLEIEFFVHDPDGHLGWIELYATYGDSLSEPILGAAGATLTSAAAHVNASINIQPVRLPVGSVAPSDYGQALTMGAASSPHWYGGMYRLTVPATTVFPETCCYQLVLHGYKRTLLCGGGTHWNLSEYSFMIVRP